MNDNKKLFDPYHSDDEQPTHTWEGQDTRQLVEAIKRRNAAAMRPKDKQKLRSRKKVDEVLLKIFDE